MHMNYQPSKEEIEVIKLLSNSELVKLSFDIGTEIDKGGNDAFLLVPLAKAICKELGQRQLKNRLC